MRHLRFLPLVMLLSAVLIGCTLVPSGQRLRLKNDSTAAIENLTVIFPQERVAFGTLAPNTMSEYKTFANGVYGYAAYEYTLNGETITQPVIDWVGEKPMDGSAFTYTLRFHPASEQFMRIELANAARDQ